MRYEADAIRISHERLNDEVIIINFESGAYYSGTGSFADLWSLLLQGASDSEAADHLAALYGLAATKILPDLREVIGQLLAKNLLAEAPGRDTPPVLSLPDGERGDWAAPAFAEYTGMWDLIQLDPIHEVSEAGWPLAPPKATA